MKYIVLLPADVDGSMSSQKAVLQIEMFNTFMWKVVAPLHPCIEPFLLIHAFRYLEVPGPARLLSNEEYVQVLIEAHASMKDISTAKRWLGVEEDHAMLFYTMARRLIDAISAYYALYPIMDQALANHIRTTRRMMQHCLETRQESPLYPLIMQLVMAVEPLNDPLLDVYVLQAKSLLEGFPTDTSFFHSNGCGKDDEDETSAPVSSVSVYPVKCE